MMKKKMKMMMIFNVVIRNAMDAEGFWIITITAIHQTMTLRFVQDCKRLVGQEGLNVVWCHLSIIFSVCCKIGQFNRENTV